MITLFDRWDNYIRTLQYISAYHEEELNGADILTVETYEHLFKGNRLVWQDNRGRWHEHIVEETEENHDSNGKPTMIATCLDSISETSNDFIIDRRPTDATISSALATTLEVTRWGVGETEDLGSNSVVLYHRTARESLNVLIERWGCEMRTDISVSGDHVSDRKVSMLVRRGTNNGKRFVYTKDIASIKRTVLIDNPVTRLFGYGRGEEVGEDSYGRRITFAEVNDGKEYIEDNEAKEIWGRPDGDGDIAHSDGMVIFENCEDPQELLELTQEYFELVKEIRVSYECSVIDLERAGYSHEGVDLGDDAAIIDKEFTPELRAQGRVTKIRRNLDNYMDTEVTIGNIVSGLEELMNSQAAAVQSLKDKSANWDVPVYLPSSWLNQVIDGLNQEFEAGGSYKYESTEHGILLSSVPLDKNFKPVTEPATAMQLTGGGFRIANELNSDGTFKWRTFGNGDGFVADVIIAGRLIGGNTFFDLDTGILQTSGSIDEVPFRVELSPTSGIQFFSGENLIGGLEIVNGQMSVVASKLKNTNNPGYLNCGSTESSGVVGFEYMAPDAQLSDSVAPNFGIIPVYHSTSKKMTGYGRFYNGQMHELVQNGENKGFSIGFRGSDVSPGLAVGYPRFYAQETQMGMLLNDRVAIWITTDGDIYCRSGTKGFGWVNGQFRDDLTFG